MPTTRPFAPGFRLSSLDVVVLVLGALGVFALWPIDASASLIVGWTVGHFFLFCNVLRMQRRFELIWAAVFVGLCTSTQLSLVPTWPQTFAASLLCTLLVSALQLRSPSYHGVLWQRVNPNLENWWNARQNRLRSEAGR
jgi:hypothetical protein